MKPKSTNRRISTTKVQLLLVLITTVLLAAVGLYMYCKPRYERAQAFVLDLPVPRDFPERAYRPVSIDQVSDHFIHALEVAEFIEFSQDKIDSKEGIRRALPLITFPPHPLTESSSTVTVTRHPPSNRYQKRIWNIERSLTERFLARRIKSELGDKQRILELFVNRIYFGGGFYGIAAASNGYFGKEANKLTAGEAAALAAVIKNPYRLSPLRFPEACQKKRNEILSSMQREGHITREEMEHAQSQPVMTVE